METIDNSYQAPAKKESKLLSNQAIYKGIKRLILKPFSKDEYLVQKDVSPRLSLDMWTFRKPLNVQHINAKAREKDENGDSKIVYWYEMSDGNYYREDWLEPIDLSIGSFLKLMRGQVANSKPSGSK